MARFSPIAGFRNPKTRPRFIMWLGAALSALALFVVMGGIIGTSTLWFCSSPCHIVQADTITAYKASAHANISCMACHEPVNATPVVLLLAKAKSIGEIPPTVTGTFELPLNKLSAYALNEHEMGTKQCKQCHTSHRNVTPSTGIIIKHDVHEKEDITCTTCHNRVAHNDAAIKFSLEGNALHQDFMKMDACFRCHDLEAKRRARGDCALCHPKGFNLVPATHEGEWLPKGHAEAARESLKEFGAAEVEAEELISEGVSEKIAVPVEHCSTCHKPAFCSACHDKLAAKLEVSAKD